MSDRKVLKIAFRERLHSKRFLLPNLVTLCNMFCGFLAATYSANGNYGKAAIAIFIAIILDGLDGRVARRFNATSKFGVEFDSFSDLVSFGVAPAILMYHWSFKTVAPDFGVIMCFLFVLCSACRLARFNIAHDNLQTFTGLPTPGAAAVVASIVYLMPDAAPSNLGIILSSIICITISYLMVCNIPFFSIKTIRLENFSLRWRIIFGVLIGLLWYDSSLAIITLAISYAASGPVMAVFGTGLKNKKQVSAENQVKSEVA